MKKVIIKKSKIEGSGVFANRDFKKGEIVIKWDKTKKLNKDEYKKLSAKERKYVSFIGGKYIYFQAPERYVNHSCNPNTQAKDFGDIAIRDIKKGEEITSDYEKEKAPNLNFGCHCGSKNCRGFIKN